LLTFAATSRSVLLEASRKFIGQRLNFFPLSARTTILLEKGDAAKEKG
jgi:hypothetical protein